MTPACILFLIIIVQTNGQSDRKSSLTFVIDVTNSMRTVIGQVEQHANAIFNTVINSNESYIENFVLVTFADIDKFATSVNNVTDTKNKDEFKDALQLSLVSGGDCPEYSMSGILTGIESSAHGSTIYVFTDASAKDIDVYDIVKDRAEKKEIQVIFVLTGKCNIKKFGSKGFDVYETLARDTSGQVFNLHKDKVTDILKYIKDSIISRRIILAAKSFPPGKGHTFTYTTDHDTSDTTISITCLNPLSMAVKGPDDKVLETSKFVELNYATVSKVSETKLGNHTVTIDCEADSRVIVTAKSKIQFCHGFSQFIPASLNDTTVKPGPDGKTYLTIKVVGNFLPQSVMLLDMDDNIIPGYTMPLKTLDSNQNLSITEPFHTPYSVFRIVVTGVNLAYNETIHRIGTTLVEPQNPLLETPKQQKPTISIEKYPKIEVEVDSSLQLKCFVSAYPKPNITLEKNGIVLETDVFVYDLPYTYVSVHKIHKISENATYKCKANNDEGSDEQSVIVQVIKEAPLLDKSSKTNTFEEGTNASLHCRIIKGIPTPTIHWYYHDEVSNISVKINEAMNREDVLLTNVNRTQAGTYKCVAKNVVASDSMELSLVVEYAPTVDEDFKRMNVKDGEDVTLSCSVDGVPEPDAIWSKDDKALNSTKFVSGSDHCLRFKADLDDKGVYKCISSNKFGSDSKIIIVEVEKPASVLISKGNFIDAEYGEPLNITCEAVGYPTPNIVWTHINNRTQVDALVEVPSPYRIVSYLSIEKVTENATYLCTANNTLGNDEKNVTIQTVRKATFEVLKSPENKTYDIAYKGTYKFGCKADAYPSAEVNWYKNGKVLSKDDILVSSDGFELSIKNMQPVDEGKYMCEIKNIHHVEKYPFDIRITGVVKPKITAQDTLYIPEHSATKISCRIEKGYPIPTIHWYYKDKASDVLLEDFTDKEDLSFADVERTHGGTYKCNASNIVGSDIMESTLVIQYTPNITNDFEPITVEAGEEVTLNCDTEGVPEPVVKWSKDDKPLLDPKFILRSDHRLIFKTELDDSGVYKCLSSNKLGSVSKSVLIEVQTPPTVLVTEGYSIDAEYGEPLNITCEVVGYPTPDIVWTESRNKTKQKALEEVRSPHRIVSYLSIEKVTENATYQCTANNTLGNDEKNVTIQTLRKATFEVLESPENKTYDIAYKDTYKFGCKADAYPSAEVNWYKNGGVLSKDDISVSSDGFELSIKNMQPVDEGKYMCEIKNIHHVEKYPFEIRITGVVKPKITAQDTLYIPEHSATKISCRIEKGYPIPTIHWYYKDKASDVLLEDFTDKEDLSFADVERTHGGTYKCNASNIVGSDIMESTLVIQYTPNITNDFEPITVEAGEEVTLNCDTEGVPEPVVKWSKDDKPLLDPKFILRSDHRLIFKTELDDSGVYKCLSSNKLGSVSKSVLIEVQTPPTVLVTEGYSIDAEYGEPLNITCEVVGYPTPDIVWTESRNKTKQKALEEVRSPHRIVSYLSIEKVTENATYQCTANNTFGNDEKNVTIQTLRKATFEVLESPENKTYDIAYKDTYKFGCKADAYPSAEVNWYKNGGVLSKDDISVSSDGFELSIKNMQPVDEGKYMCEIKNIHHVEKYPFEIRITGVVKPKITAQDTLYIPEHSATKISCRIEKGYPIPTIHWYYKDKASDVLLEDFTDKEDLSFADVERTHGGTYKCNASNIVGSDIMESTLVIQYTPNITNDFELITVEAGEEVTLNCDTEGVPEPVVKWSKDDKPLLDPKFILRSDHRLIFKTELDDSGVYKCLSSNKLGSDSKSALIEVQTPPTVLVTEGYSIDAKYGEPLNITCEVVGYPTPGIVWTESRNKTKQKALEEVRSPHRIVSYLSIEKVTENATYQCTANNTLGNDEKNVTIQTLRKATFEVLESPENKTYDIAYKDTYKFGCKADAYPSAEVNWYKNGGVLSKDDISVSSDGLILSIKNMQPGDAGKYMCEIKNIHHVEKYPFEIQITGVDKPKITATLDTLYVPENSATKINCRIEKGTPKPTIRWYYMSKVSDGFVEIEKAKDEEDLLLSNVKRTHKGTYKCEAKNVAGSDLMESHLVVEYAPTIENELETITAKAGSKVKLACVADGIPALNVEWSKDNKSLTEVLKFVTNDDHSLIFNVDVEDRGIFKCSASNSLGTSTKTVTLEVEIPPTVFIEGDRKQQVEIGEALQLKCNVRGYPPPDISWTDTTNLVVLSGSTSVVKFPYEHLSILSIDKVSKNTTYQCEAKNTHGDETATVVVEAMMKKYFYMLEEPQDTIIAYEAEGKLYCRVDAYPPANIDWYKDSNLLSSNDGLKISSDGSVLTFEKIQPNQDGKYICVANNSENAKVSIAKVTISGVGPPSIEDDETSYVVEKGHKVDIPCEVHGKPTPTVKWTKNLSTAEFVTAKDHRFKLATVLKDTGDYICTATNFYGTATRTVKINVYTIGVLGKGKGNFRDVNEEDNIKLECITFGKPKPTLEWLFEGTKNKPVIPPKKLVADRRDRLFINGISFEEHGRYTCVARNKLGGRANFTYEIRVNTAVEIHNTERILRAVDGDRVLKINCNATGYPKPHFRWIIDGAANTEDSDTIFLKNITKRHNSSEITCEARNNNTYNDRNTFTFEIIVDEYPSLDNPNSTLKVDAGQTALVTCPVPHRKGDLRWYHNNKKIHEGELYVMKAKSSIAGLYTCRVSDGTKAESANVLLEVTSQLRFKNTAVKTSLSLGFGEWADLDCLAVGNPIPKLSWSFNGRAVSNNVFLRFKMDQSKVGKYICEATNDIDSISRVIEVTINDCLLKIDPDIKHQPLILTQYLLSPSYKYHTGYLYMPKKQSIILACPITSKFNLFDYNYVSAYCSETGGVTQLHVDNQPYNYSDIKCTEELKPRAEWTGKTCYGDDSETVKIVFDVLHKVIEIFEVCMDLSYDIPIYAKHKLHTPLADDISREMWFNDRLMHDYDRIYDVIEQTRGISRLVRHRYDHCVFSKRQLVNPLDVFPGVPQKATYTHLNVVPHWSTCSSKNWNTIESRVRKLAESNDKLIVWTGTANRLKLKNAWGEEEDIVLSNHYDSSSQPVSTYLWKVVQNPVKGTSLAIIQLNIPDITLSETRRYVKCKDICHRTAWMKGSEWSDVSKGYTFCCSLKDFEDKFGYKVFGNHMNDILR